ncbi:secondary thiamine-phosphate synthase enzyme YjbQ [Halosegnis sp.]|uniref:secondary thiamine-phosphate synthase enzyme YjbQ n=1 Tax=Halosegnis sp. TaxID=2864959 RepID=UPI0035D46459
MRFEVTTDEKIDVVDVTDQVAEAVPRDRRGTVTVYCRHTTAGLVINEAEPRLMQDIHSFLRASVPAVEWRHDEIDGNAASHLASMVLGRGVTVPVADGRLDLGTHQSVLLVDCDGPRTRSIDVV